MELNAVTRELILDRIDAIGEELEIQNSLINDKNQARFQNFRMIKVHFLEFERDELKKMIINNEAEV